ncbi:ABC transporter substrate-binding protein [Shewanella sp. UCD-KL12]|uniref:substrate-binding periplasmic protein n=1 Tax=Shewanella sp. UCD-KL12 TaxID=1917163 RepID=UPI0009708B66|nr:transporter substrate-binding domain-containing protein [Shewanella sp. UCD-KL12]
MLKPIGVLKRALSLTALLVTALVVLMAQSTIIAASAKPLKIVSNEYPPFYSHLLADYGVVSHLAHEALKRANHTITHDFYPFSRAVLLTKAGYADGIIGIWYRKSREEWVAYSLPLLSVQVVFLKRVDRDIDFEKLSDLSQYSIGVGRGYANPEEFDEAGLKTEEGSSDSENLKKLYLGRMDLILISKDVADFLIEQSAIDFRGEFEVIGEPLSLELFHFGISKNRADHQVIIEQFNQALNEMKQDGSVLKILEQHGFEANPYWLQELKQSPRN